MKHILLLITILPTLVFSQFGFDRNNDIEVIKNNIQQKYAWVGGLDYSQYSNIDLNLDGTQDLFIFDKTCNKVLTFIQNGAPGQIDFEYAPQYETIFPSMYAWTLLVDYDGDGKKDIWTSSPGGATVHRNVSTATGGLEFTLASVYLPTTYTYSGTVINTYVNVGQGDLPAITDADGDGDIDVLAFYFNSQCVRYYKNMSQELYNHSDSLVFKTVNVCYGNFVEGNLSNDVYIDSCCSNQIDNPEIIFDGRPIQLSDDRHSGSSLLSLDLDADDMEELVIGDISYKNLVRMMNDGNTPNTNIDLIAPDYAFPSYNTPVEITLFPAAFHVDINNDNQRDLMVAPNLPVNSHNYSSNWFYLNDSIDNYPKFNLQTESFLQGDMIDGGSESYPVFFDYNGDGLKDLIVAISDRFDPVSSNGYSQMFYYENTGTTSSPEYTLVTEDFMNLSNFNGVKHLFYRPTFGDADGDGDKDMLLSELNDTMYYFENVAGPGNTAQFVNPTPFKNHLGVVINEGIQVSPKFVDLDRDGRDDLVIGKRSGKLAYYHNNGGVNAYSFEFITGTLGGVDVSEYWTTDGVATPEFVDIDTVYHLICGARNGYLHYYNQIDGNLTGNFNLADSTLEDIYIGTYSAPAIYDIDGDNRLEMFVGNKRGGLTAFQSAVVTSVGLTDYTTFNNINVYPNPATDQLNIDLSKITIGSFTSTEYVLMDISGKAVKSGKIYQTKTSIDCTTLTKGVYFLSVNIDGLVSSHKIVIN